MKRRDPAQAAAMREDLQQDLTATLADKVQLHDHPSCHADSSPTLQHR
jgi:hypothetical protein